MRLLEGLEKYGHQIHLALSAMMKDMFNMDLTDDKAREIIDTLALSDMLKLDTAIDDNDTATIMDMLGKYIDITEYSLPGRGGNLTSQASSRPTSSKNPGTTSTTQMTKPVAGGNKTATGGSDEIDTDTQDQQDAEKEIADKQKELDDLKKKAGIK
jgi:hypothetical protein